MLKRWELNKPADLLLQITKTVKNTPRMIKSYFHTASSQAFSYSGNLFLEALLSIHTIYVKASANYTMPIYT